MQMQYNTILALTLLIATKIAKAPAAFPSGFKHESPPARQASIRKTPSPEEKTFQEIRYIQGARYDTLTKMLPLKTIGMGYPGLNNDMRNELITPLLEKVTPTTLVKWYVTDKLSDQTNQLIETRLKSMPNPPDALATIEQHKQQKIELRALQEQVNERQRGERQKAHQQQQQTKIETAKQAKKENQPLAKLARALFSRKSTRRLSNSEPRPPSSHGTQHTQ